MYIESKINKRIKRLRSARGEDEERRLQTFDFWGDPEEDGCIRFCPLRDSDTVSRQWTVPCSLIDSTPDDELKDLIELHRVQKLIAGE